MAEQWYVARNQRKHGPFTAAKLKELASQGRIEPNDMLLKEGTQKWVPASAVKGLFSEKPTAPPALVEKSEGGGEDLQEMDATAALKRKEDAPLPRWLLLAGGGAALGLVFFVCLGCAGFSLFSGNGSGGHSASGEWQDSAKGNGSGRHGASGEGQGSARELIGKWRDEAGLTVVEYTEDGKYVLTVNGQRIEWRYAFRDNETVEITKGNGSVTLTVLVEGDTLTETDDKGTVVKYSRVGAAKKNRGDVAAYKKLIVGKWKYARDDPGALGDVIDQYTADGRIIVWDAKDGAVAGRGKYQFVSDDKVKISLDGHNYTATIIISGDEMTVTDEDGKSSAVKRVK